MSTKAGFPCALLLTVLGLCAATAQEKSPGKADESKSGEIETAPKPRQAPADSTTPAPTPVTVGEPGRLSSWIVYTRPDAGGPIGGDGPIFAELYARTGPVFAFGSGILASSLQDGWMVQAGGRSLFFNPTSSAAWTADLGLSHSYNHLEPGTLAPHVVTFDFPQPANLTLLPGFPAPQTQNRVVQMQVLEFQRTNVNLSLGREWYLSAPADADGVKWRAGFDVGGRLGTAKAGILSVARPGDFPTGTFIGTIGGALAVRTVQGEERTSKGHLTDTIYGYFGALHTDVEIPSVGCCTFLGGLRLECGYTSCTILKDMNNSNVADVNLLLNLGVRF